MHQFDMIGSADKIPAYAVNLRSRTDRHLHIMLQFKDKDEFDFTLVEAIEAKSGRLGL